MTPPKDAVSPELLNVLADRKPLSCNPSDTKYEVLYKGQPIARPNYAFWDKDEQKFCIGWEGYLDKNPKHIQWQLYKEPSARPSPKSKPEITALVKDFDAIRKCFGQIESGTGSSCGRERESLERIQSALTANMQVGDVEGLHSKIDMDIEDEIGRELTLEESKIVGLAIRKALA